MGWIIFGVLLSVLVSFLCLRISVHLDVTVTLSTQTILIKIFIGPFRIIKKTINVAMASEGEEEFFNGNVNKQFKHMIKSSEQALGLIKHIIQKSTINNLSWQSRIGTGEAHTTGIIVGGLQAIKELVVGYLNHVCPHMYGTTVMVKPNFQTKTLQSELHCMVSMRVGKAMFSILKGLKDRKNTNRDSDKQVVH